MENSTEQKPNESFKDYMDRILREARERYDRMSPEDQQLLDEAARRHHERAKSEIMASFPICFEDKEGESSKGETDIEPREED